MFAHTPSLSSSIRAATFYTVADVCFNLLSAFFTACVHPSDEARVNSNTERNVWNPLGLPSVVLLTKDGKLIRQNQPCLGAPLTVAIGGLASLAGAGWFGLQLPKIRVEARRLIVAQAAAREASRRR